MLILDSCYHWKNCYLATTGKCAFNAFCVLCHFHLALMPFTGFSSNWNMHSCFLVVVYMCLIWCYSMPSSSFLLHVFHRFHFHHRIASSIIHTYIWMKYFVWVSVVCQPLLLIHVPNKNHLKILFHTIYSVDQRFFW